MNLNRWCRVAMGVFAGASLWVGSAGAQDNWRTTAVPFYSPEQYVQASGRQRLADATQWKAAAATLRSDLQSWCTGAPVPALAAMALQLDWRAAVTAWDRLDSIALGPLIERRSARSVDFMPARAAMLERAARSGAKDVAAMELVGAPAKGFEALEWLLWPDVPTPGTPPCGYAQSVAEHLQREADAVVSAFGTQAGAEPDQEQTLAAFAEAVNQWVGGVERLRWAFMRKPVEVARSRNEAAVFPRQRSGQSRDSWAARWSTLRDYAVLGARATPQATGGEQLIAFETWLRSRGANDLADKLVQATAQADRAMAQAQPQQPASVEAAADALGRLTRLMQAELAPALNVSIGFSDADGD
ncbi:imelysin family protein [Comamonadaceae bacterium G21597-S1]|nr:imelysin family protein [Comamonadaceae bacterium G21597-S1]